MFTCLVFSSADARKLKSDDDADSATPSSSCVSGTYATSKECMVYCVPLCEKQNLIPECAWTSSNSAGCRWPCSCVSS